MKLFAPAALAVLLLPNSKVTSFQIGSTTTRPTKTCLFSGQSSNEVAAENRRSFLSAAVMAAGAAVTASSWYPLQALAADVDYKAVSNDIAELVRKNPDWGPTMVRLGAFRYVFFLFPCCESARTPDNDQARMGAKISFPH